MVTAPGEKFPIGRRPVRNWTSRTISSLFFVQKITFYSYESQQKLLSQELHFLTPVCTKAFVYLGFALDPTGGAYGAPLDPLPVFRGHTSKKGR